MKWNVVLAFVVFVVAAISPMNPAATWTSPNSDETTGAPATYAGPDQFVGARRAAGDAAAQASFLVQGTQKLVDGTDQLKDGSGELADGIKAARDGADQLSKGMVDLQNGTGALADGATRLADSVGGAVDQVVGFDAIRGQVLSAIDSTLRTTKNSRDPQVVDLRTQLEDLRRQVETAEIPQDMTTQLNELKDGSRELANQLSVPGYAYHDGIYTATNGARDLANGLNEMNNKVDDATGGIDELVDGASKIDDMATTTQDRISDVQRAMPAPAPVAAGSGTESEGPSSALAPLAAMLVSALAVIAGIALALAAYAARGRNRWLTLGIGTAFITAAGLILVGILGTNLSPFALAVSGLALALVTLASAGFTWIVRSSFGRTGGTAVAGIFGLVQMAIVGWVWSTAATGNVDLVWRTASSALPMHWSTAAISAAGNQGSATAMWTGVALSAFLALLGAAAVAMTTRAVDEDEYEEYEDYYEEQ
ncbi:hypothetical protein QP994_10580 [Corynebacterium sp. MSK044]|uniref:hypothetical protein n=1 Tax=Corynebacterium sp. MSK044 TaxID=3050195 RepID=UPI00254F2D2D|nr:hypothetical protein [Corynebacterium sp. MSK044]MDK8798315.1 hypothetical protein [Corynebacterium sp. MSK044]